ncbi:MAG: rhomboid family intramembrane serine protease [Sandaracinaceae bacterium]
MRHCPDCAQPLSVLDDGTVEIDGCPRCGGVFYDFRELSTRLGTEIERWAEDGLAYPLGLSARRCPAHGSSGPIMEARRFDDAGGLEIDVCPECKGIWLEDGEEASLKEFAVVLERSWEWLMGNGDGSSALAMMEQTPLAALARMHGVRRLAVIPWLLVGLTLGLVVLTMFKPDLIAAFGFTPRRWLSAPWTLVTYGFLHAGLAHWANNMVVVGFIGTPLVLYLGRVKFVALLVLSIVAGALAHGAIYPESATPMVGISAACLGLLGALLVIMPKVRVGASRRGLHLSALAASVFIVLQQVAFAFAYDMIHIAWTAHLAGLLVGIIAGLVWRNTPPTG